MIDTIIWGGFVFMLLILFLSAFVPPDRQQDLEEIARAREEGDGDDQG